jgi:hypothetical protein
VTDSGDRARRPGSRADGPRRDDSRPNRGQPASGRGPRQDAPSSRAPRYAAERGGRDRTTPEERDPYNLKSVRERYDAPGIPDEVRANQLDKVARIQLKTLSKENADEVARHLVMAARHIDDDAPLAHQHALAAARRAGRIAVVRETLAITAYSVGDFALALRELRTYRRISGQDDQLPMMVDSERGLGRSDKGLELGRSVPRDSLPVEVQVELAIAMSGARLDLGQTEDALSELEIPQLDPDTAFPWSPALFDAYAAVLEDLGRDAEAEEWYRRSELALDALAGADDEDETETVEILEEDITLEEDIDPAGAPAGDIEPSDADSRPEEFTAAEPVGEADSVEQADDAGDAHEELARSTEDDR